MASGPAKRRRTSKSSEPPALTVPVGALLQEQVKCFDQWLILGPDELHSCCCTLQKFSHVFSGLLCHGPLRSGVLTKHKSFDEYVNTVLDSKVLFFLKAVIYFLSERSSTLNFHFAQNSLCNECLLGLSGVGDSLLAMGRGDIPSRSNSVWP